MKLEDRMKLYEEAARATLPRRMPIIIRVDGKAFSKYTVHLNKPFDRNFISVMEDVATALCQEVQGAQIAFTQSDEVSVLVHGYKKFESEPWFANQVQKMVSVAAAVSAATFTANSWRMWCHRDEPSHVTQIMPGYFDARVFVLPEAEVNNYFVWRQRDGIRNSVAQFAQHHFSHKQLHKKSVVEMKEMCKAAGHDWDALPPTQRKGRCVYRHREVVDGVERGHFRVDTDVPLFGEQVEYITRHLATEDE